jgi:CubicO group peptidase (beta-lactamase class C family)
MIPSLRKRSKTLLTALVLAVAFVALMGVSPSQTVAAQKPSLNFGMIDAFIAAQLKKHGLPGATLAITQADKIIYLNGYGQADTSRELTPQTPMYIGSTSKSFTALAIMQLVETGKIELDAPVRRYLPWFKIADETASQTLTVNHFLHQASGLSEATYNVSLPDNASIEDAVRSMADMTLTAPVGKQSMYFNMNYDVLALIVEKVSGQSYADYVTSHIFLPLNMLHSYTDPAQARADGLAQGYSRIFGFAIPKAQPHRTYELGAGYLISTAEDMAHYIIAMSNRGQYEGVSLLSAKGMQALFTPRQQEGFAYGMGWFTDNVNGIPRIQHGGANETFKTYVDFYPMKHTGIVLMINEGYLIDSYISSEQMFQGVEKLVLGLGVPDPAEGVSVPTIGYALLALVTALTLFQGWQLWRLRSWRIRAQAMSARARALDIALNFLIPSVITGIVIWQSAQFFGYRFNLGYQMRMLLQFQVMPDIGILMLVGTLPDYAQGLIKSWWLLRSGKQQPTRLAMP